MKSIRKKILLLTIGIAFIMLACSSAACTYSEASFEQLKIKTEAAALELSKMILQSQFEDSAQIAKYLTENGWSVIIAQEESPSYLSNPQSVYSFWNDITIEKIASCNMFLYIKQEDSALLYSIMKMVRGHTCL